MVYSLDNIHKSVLLDEVIKYLAPSDNETYVDGTFGAGGYSRAILSHSNCKLIAFDRDPDVSLFAKQLMQEVGIDRFKFFNKQFSAIKSYLQSVNGQVNGLVLDLGISSMQVDNTERGFAFSFDGPLDMRMSKLGISAKDVVNSYKENDLADIIYKFGGESNSRKIAKKIVMTRRESPINTTSDLRQLIHSVSRKRGKIDSATKTFQALRIYVNNELAELELALKNLATFLIPGARVVIVTFHSLEDRIVKYFFRDNKDKFTPINKKVIKPQYEEIKNNRRARSAKLRAVIFRGANDV